MRGYGRSRARGDVPRSPGRRQLRRVRRLVAARREWCLHPDRRDRARARVRSARRAVPRRDPAHEERAVGVGRERSRRATTSQGSAAGLGPPTSSTASTWLRARTSRPTSRARRAARAGHPPAWLRSAEGGHRARKGDRPCPLARPAFSWRSTGSRPRASARSRSTGARTTRRRRTPPVAPPRLDWPERDRDDAGRRRRQVRPVVRHDGRGRAGLPTSCTRSTSRRVGVSTPSPPTPRRLGAVLSVRLAPSRGTLPRCLRPRSSAVPRQSADVDFDAALDAGSIFVIVTGRHPTPGPSRSTSPRTVDRASPTHARSPLASFAFASRQVSSASA